MKTLYRGGQVYSPEPFANAMLVDGDTVVWVGADEAAHSYVDVADTVVELHGSFVAPGFVDSHVHVTSTGLAMVGIDLSNARSADELLHAVASCRDAHVLGHGWDDTSWNASPTREMLDAVAGDRPVYLSRIDVHSAVVSSALLRAVPGIESMPGYSPDGRVSMEAHHAVRRVALTEIPDELRSRAMRTALDAAASVGIVSLHECGGPDISGRGDFRDLMALAQRDDLPEIIGYWGELHALDAIAELGAYGLAGDLFVDGSLGSHTACLTSAYTDASTTGAAYLSSDEIGEHIVACTTAGVQAGFHVIGDEAINKVVAGFAIAARRCGVPALRSTVHRLEHVELLSPENIAMLNEFGVLLSMQPVFDELWGGSDGMYVRRLGAQRAEAMNPFADVIRAGVPLALSSDSPVTPLGPWRAIRAAVEHHTEAQRISTRAAFNAHTRGGRRAARQHDQGVLSPGMKASFAVWRVEDVDVVVPDARLAQWSTDPRAGVAPLPVLSESLPTCLMTVRDGRTLFGGLE